MTGREDLVSVRDMVDDVQSRSTSAPATSGSCCARAQRPRSLMSCPGRWRLLLAGPERSVGRPMPDGRTPGPGGWNRIHLIVDAIAREVTRLRAAGPRFRDEIVTGPGGQQVLIGDPSGNPIALFYPAGNPR